ncbi:hypothetical protein COCOBI_07-0260 [Coccomyxa sp. Obi]|nr:hypothetical protein COCOBI_07-0260 [Coccomyxa sp. Obi]
MGASHSNEAAHWEDIRHAENLEKERRKRLEEENLALQHRQRELEREKATLDLEVRQLHPTHLLKTSDAILEVKREMFVESDSHINVAVVGLSGTGKSTLINRLRKVPDNLPDSDGVACSVHIERPKGVITADIDPGEDEEPDVRTEDEREEHFVKQTRQLDRALREADISDDIQRRICIDPGGDVMAFGVLDHDSKEEPAVVRCPSAEYRDRAGFPAVLRKRRNWVRSSGVEELMTHAPSGKLVDLRGLREHIRYHLGVLERVLDHFGAARQRRLAFTSHVSKARAMDSMALRIAPRGVKTLVVYGAADFSHAMKGRAAVPYKRLKACVAALEDVTLVEVGECNTSRLCSRCHEELEGVRSEVMERERIVKRGIHAVKVCRHCSTTWNRDLNAARNIRHVFERIRESGVRPEVFRPRRRAMTTAEEGLRSRSLGGLTHPRGIKGQQHGFDADSTVVIKQLYKSFKEQPEFIEFVYRRFTDPGLVASVPDPDKRYTRAMELWKQRKGDASLDTVDVKRHIISMALHA